MGRWSNEKRASMAQQAASEAQDAARVADTKPELPLETTSPVEPQSEGRQEEEQKSELTLRKPRNDIRERAMKEITDRDIQTKTGLGIELDLDESEKPQIQEKKEIPQDPPPPTAESMLQGGKFSAPTVRVKVDGEEFEVSQSDIDEAGGVKAYQIMRAADNRLKQANEVLAKAQAARESKPEVKQSADEFLKSKIETLRWGTPEESAAAFKEILEKQNKPIDHNMIVEMAADRIRHDDAVKQFDKEFTDIGASQMHLKLIVALRNERLQKGHPGDWGNFYRSLGNEVRAVMPKSNNSPATGTTSQSTEKSTSGTTSQASEKEERKSSIVNLPQAAARAALSEEPKPETRQDILNQMRKTRGFPTA